MASTTENKLEIDGIKQELAKTIKPSEMSKTQRRQLLSTLYGGTMPPMKHDHELLANGDTVYGKGIPGVNGGGFFFGTVISKPITDNADVDQDIQL